MLTIGKVAKECGITVEAIRFYEKEGLIPEPARTESGYRQYPESTLGRLRFIARAKHLGFTLAEVKQLLFISDKDRSSAEVKELTQHKISVIDKKMADLERIRDALSALNEQCSGEGSADCCPIIGALIVDDFTPKT